VVITESGTCRLANVACKAEAVITLAAGFLDVILDRFGELAVSISTYLPARTGRGQLSSDP
jgi:hypothetical protein